MTTLSAVAQDLPEYDAERVHLSRLSVGQLHDVREPPGVHDARRAGRAWADAPRAVDVIGGGAVVTTVLADELARRAGIDELVVSEHDILDGIAMSVLLGGS